MDIGLNSGQQMLKGPNKDPSFNRYEGFQNIK